MSEPTPEQANPACGGCGGPHPFDTSIPSVVWNAVIRAKGLSEYLCATCVVREFVRAGVSFTATLWGDGFGGQPIEVRVGGQVAEDATKVSEENTRLRVALEARTEERDKWKRTSEKLWDILGRVDGERVPALRERAEAAERERDEEHASALRWMACVENADVEGMKAEDRARAAESEAAALRGTLDDVAKASGYFETVKSLPHYLPPLADHVRALQARVETLEKALRDCQAAAKATQEVFEDGVAADLHELGITRLTDAWMDGFTNAHQSVCEDIDRLAEAALAPAPVAPPSAAAQDTKRR